MPAGRRDCADKLEGNLGVIGTYAKRANRSVRQRFCSCRDDGDVHRLPPPPPICSIRQSQKGSSNNLDQGLTELRSWWTKCVIIRSWIAGNHRRYAEAQDNMRSGL
jgi:hypothetical protein